VIRFVVATPLQAISAIEAGAALHLEPSRCELIVLQPPEPLGQRRMERVLHASTWGKRIEIGPASGGTSNARRTNAVRKLGKDRGLDAVVIGSYRDPLMRHLANAGAARRAEVVLIDEGFDTLRAAAQRAGGGADDLVDRKGLAAVVPLDLVEPARVRFVTMYDLQAGPDDPVLRHSFAWLRGRAGGAVRDRSALFVGTSLVESGAIDAAWYEDHVLAACAGGRVYVPHRLEHEDKLARLAKGGVSVRPLPGPIEFEVIETAWRPDSVTTIFSSALHTLPRLVDVPMRAVVPPTSAVAPEWQEALAARFNSLPVHAPTVVVA
jgi:hypothetical protein